MVKPFREWFEDKYGVPFPAKPGDGGLYNFIISRAFDAMAEYVELVCREVQSVKTD